MKKIKLLVLFMVLVVPIIGYGQISLGPKVGINIASQFKTVHTVPKLGLSFGGAVDIPIVNGFSIQGEFLVTQKGYREEYKGKTIFDEMEATYLEIPAMAKYTISKVNLAYFFQGGAYWGLWTKGSYLSRVDGSNITVEDYPFEKDFDKDGFKDNRSDFGLVAEAGITYDNFGSGVLALGFRYSHGLVPTNNLQNPGSGVQSNLNKVFTLSITYFLFL